MFPVFPFVVPTGEDPTTPPCRTTPALSILPPLPTLQSLLPSSSPLTSLASSPYTPRARASSLPPPLPPLSSDGIIPSSPVVGTREQRTTTIRAKAQKKRLATIQHNKVELEVLKADLVVQAAQAGKEAEQRKVGFFEEILASIKAHGYTLSELLLYVSDPIYKQGIARWEHLFRDRISIPKILNIWVSLRSEASREQVHTWAVDYISKEVKREARGITKSGYLQTLNRPVNSALVLGFNMSNIQAWLQEHGLVFMKVFESFAMSTRQLKNASPGRLAKKMTVVTSAALSLLGEYSYNNNLAKKVMGLYMYSTGSQRQPLTVMSHIGVSEGYDAITGKKRKRRKKKTVVSSNEPTHMIPSATLPPTTSDAVAATAEDVLKTETYKGGSLRQLSDSMVDMARAIASTGLFGTSYDNINLVFRVAEQIVGRTDAQENGTCSTIWPLFKAALINMQVQDLEDAFDKAQPLRIMDIVLNPRESKQLYAALHHCILRIIVIHGGEGFEKFRDDLERTTPHTEHKIDLHQTPLHPLPALDIDESTIVGGAQVIDAIFEILGVQKLKDWLHTVKFFCGDQLTIARLRSLVNIRAGHEGGYTGFSWGVWMPGLFHAKMADIHGFFVTHWGKAAAGIRNPGCLAFHNTVIQRKPILLTSLPPFRTCRDLIFVSLYARVLHCLLLVSKTRSLEDYSENFTWATLEKHAEKIMEEYANADVAADLRWRRTSGQPPAPDQPVPKDGDMVFENAVLFLRDALLSREFTDAVKIGDSGRIVLVLKTWALAFRGSGRLKYAHEMLHIIHNITCVWPKPIRDIVFNNWLVNPTGNPYSWVEVDLMQEHMNFWIKNFYRAHGSAASWDWLEMIAPCVNILRQLAQNFKQMLGTDIGTAHHPMDLSYDIPDLMDSLKEHEVYSYKKGRYLDEDDPPVQDILSVGLEELIAGRKNPLTDYNTAFCRLQARRRLNPLVGGDERRTVSTNPHASPSPLPEVLPLTTDSAQSKQPEIQLPDPGDTESDDELDEDVGDFLRWFEDGHEEPTLQLESAADVSLDMDAEDMDSRGCTKEPNDSDLSGEESDMRSDHGSGDDSACNDTPTEELSFM